MITGFRSLKDARGEFVECSPASLSRWLSKPRVYANKCDAKRWGAYRSKDGRRRREDIIECSALVYDLDAKPPTLSVLEDVFADLCAVIVSTWSATASAPRWRVVIFVTRWFSSEEFPRVQRAGAEVIDRVAVIDPQGKGVEHIWSAPAMQPGGFFAFAETGGALLDVDAALARFPKEKPLPLPEPSAVQNANRYARGALLSACQTIATAGHGMRNATLNREAFPIGRFVESGELGESDASEALVAAGVSCGLSRRDAIYTVRRALRQGARRSA